MYSEIIIYFYMFIYLLIFFKCEGGSMYFFNEGVFVLQLKLLINFS